MTRYKHNKSGLDIAHGESFVLDGVRYPAAWWKSPDFAEQMALTGLVAYEPPPPQPVDKSTLPLDRRRLRKGLLSLGVTAQMVLDEINAETDAIVREGMLIDWEDAGIYHFNHPLVTLLMGRLGLDAAAAKAKWIEMVDTV